jgi:DNA-binding NarL/FixJ family response regulator
MRERAELIHGRLDILSEPAAGTTVRLQAPLHPVHDAREQEREERQAIDSLTAREREVLQALGAGLDSQEIADELHISIRTERNHVARILAKLGVHSQLQAVLVGLRYGLIANGRESQPPRPADTRP